MQPPQPHVLGLHDGAHRSESSTPTGAVGARPDPLTSPIQPASLTLGESLTGCSPPYSSARHSAQRSAHLCKALNAPSSGAASAYNIDAAAISAHSAAYSEKGCSLQHRLLQRTPTPPYPPGIRVSTRVLVHSTCARPDAKGRDDAPMADQSHVPVVPFRS